MTLPSEQGTANLEVWGKSYRQLDGALRLYDEVDSLPETTLFGASKKSHRAKIEQIIDGLLLVLSASGAGDCRNEIRTFHHAITESLQRQTDYRERQISAPPKASLSYLESVWKTSREGYEQSIITENGKATEMRQRIEELRERFRDHLALIDVQVSLDGIDFLLKPVTQDDLVSMAAVVKNIASLTIKFEELADESKELPQQTKRDYGMYLILVHCLDRLQKRFIDEIDQIRLPQLQEYEQEAGKNIAEAQHLIKCRGPEKQLAANIEAGVTTMEACRRFASVLCEHKNVIVRENKQIKTMLAAAANTYKTMRLSINVAELMSDCQNAFKALRQILIASFKGIPESTIETRARGAHRPHA